MKEAEAAALSALYMNSGGASIDTYKELTRLTMRPSAIFLPKKHTKKSYAAQNREARKRRNNKQKRA